MISKNSVTVSTMPLPFNFDPVPHARNKWQTVRNVRVCGRWRHEDGKLVFVEGPLLLQL
jgi:hypothetical protein